MVMMTDHDDNSTTTPPSATTTTEEDDGSSTNTTTSSTTTSSAASSAGGLKHALHTLESEGGGHVVAKRVKQVEDLSKEGSTIMNQGHFESDDDINTSSTTMSSPDMPEINAKTRQARQQVLPLA